MKTHWYKTPFIGKICTLCLLGLLCTHQTLKADDTANSFDKEVDALLNSDTDIELRVQVAKVQKELAKLKNENRNLKSQLKNQLENKKVFESKLAVEILNDASAESINQALTLELQRQLKANQRLRQEIESLASKTQRILRKNGARRTELKDIENHFDKLRFEIKTDLLTSSEVKTKNDGLVMSRNSSLQVVAINLGLIDGITTGTRFSVLLGKREEAVLRVIEVSRSLSLAEIEKGQFKSVPIGTKVVRKEQQTKSKNVGIWKQQQ